MKKIIHSNPLERWKFKLKIKSFYGVLFFVCCAFTNGYSQDLTVSGKITDESTGEPLLGVNVIVKGSTNGISSDLNGDYLIKGVSSENVLVFSYLGLQIKKLR